MKTIYTLSGYNNYFNRIVKREETLQSYLNYPQLTNYHVTENVNFIPHNYINTQQVIGSYDNQFNGCGDYLLVVDNDSGEIDSRWFIISCDMVCEGQYTLNLLRDVLAEYKDSILKDTPTYLEKGYIVDNSSVLNLNKEPDITVNQIKTSELLLKQTTTPFVAMYYTRSNDASTNPMKGEIKINSLYNTKTITSTVQDYYSNEVYTKYGDINYYFTHFDTRSYLGKYVDLIYSPNNLNTYGSSFNPNEGKKPNSLAYNMSQVSGNEIARYVHNQALQEKSGIESETISYLPQPSTPPFILNPLIDEYGGDGQLVKDSTGKIYRVKLISHKKGEDNKLNTPITSGNLYNRFIGIINKGIPSNIDKEGSPNDSTFYFTYDYTEYKYEYEEVQQATIKYDMTSPDTLITLDAPYNVALIPLDVGVTINKTNSSFTTKVKGIDIASGIAEQQGSRVLDIQIVPYVPTDFTDTETGEIHLQEEDTRAYSFVKDSKGNNLSCILNLPLSRFTFNCKLSKPLRLLKGSRKLTNECTKLRLCAPDYSSFFDFNLSQWLEKDTLEDFNIDCDYKPLNAYIHVNPDFDGSIYGKDYNDPRGLIYSPKSITLITDQWQQYQVMNKNFEQSFSRQVQNLTVQQKYQRINEMVGLGIGTLGGAYSGGLTGSLFGGGKGGLIGGAIGAGASLMGGIADMTINDKLRGEQLSYMKDMHALQLGNIQAQPDTLRTVSALNNNNKLFPLVESYECTTEEIKLVENKLKYGGMSINVIVTPNDGGISSYINPKKGGLTFIKGRLILIQAIKEDYEFYQQINMELVKGVYV